MIWRFAASGHHAFQAADPIPHTMSRERELDCLVAMPAMTRGMLPAKLLKDRDVFQQRNDAENDHDDPCDLFGAAIERQQIDQIESAQAMTAGAA